MGIHDLVKSTEIKQDFHYGNHSFSSAAGPNSNDLVLFNFEEPKEDPPMFSFLPGSNDYDDAETVKEKEKTNFFI